MEVGPGTGSDAKRMSPKRKGKQKQRCRYPFKETTKLIEFVDHRYYGHLLRLLKKLRPYLLEDEEGNDFKLSRLYFNLELLSAKRQFIFDEIALFLIEVQHGLRYKQSVFIRYLSTPEHCNLGIKEDSLKSLILEAKRRNSEHLLSKLEVKR